MSLALSIIKDYTEDRKKTKSKKAIPSGTDQSTTSSTPSQDFVFVDSRLPSRAADLTHIFKFGDMSQTSPESDAGPKQKNSKVDRELTSYLEFLRINDQNSSSRGSQWRDEARTTPLFTWPVKSLVETFRQYSVLGHELTSKHRPTRKREEEAIFLNTDAPWSAFLCGSQGSGKSHTLSCMLESCIMKNPTLGKTPKPLAGIVFAYNAQHAAVACEAAFLGTKIDVNVLVAPSSYWVMKEAYKAVSPKINVYPLFLKQRHLSTQRMLTLMAFNDGSGSVPLYMEVIMSILRDMRLARGKTADSGFDFVGFRARLDKERFDTGQKNPMNLRLQLLENFMDSGDAAKRLAAQGLKTKGIPDVFQPKAGTLTIVDLTDPFVDAAGACVLFDICLSLFLEDTSGVPKIVALDEAHKFMTEGDASTRLTESLLQVIREQRHKGVRVVVATQEPTVSPKLLDLCSMTFVHRFTSPEWLRALQKHLAGASGILEDSGSESGHELARRILREVVTLNVGESLLFSPSAMLDVDVDVAGGCPEKLGVGYVKFKTRPRVTADGGRSVMAN